MSIFFDYSFLHLFLMFSFIIAFFPSLSYFPALSSLPLLLLFFFSFCLHITLSWFKGYLPTPTLATHTDITMALLGSSRYGSEQPRVQDDEGQWLYKPQAPFCLWCLWPSWYAGRSTKEAIRFASPQATTWLRRCSWHEEDANMCDPLLPFLTLCIDRQARLPRGLLWFLSAESNSLNILKEKISDNIHTFGSKGQTVFHLHLLSI